MKERIVLPEAVHHAFYNELGEMLSRYEKEHNLTPEIMLALSSQAVGALIAMQDPKTMSPDRALATVQVNIENGNANMMTHIALGRHRQ